MSKEVCECRDVRPRSQGTLLPVQAAQQGLLQLHGMSPLASSGGRDAKRRWGFIKWGLLPPTP